MFHVNSNNEEIRRIPRHKSRKNGKTLRETIVKALRERENHKVNAAEPADESCDSGIYVNIPVYSRCRLDKM
jgi:hypothetical protein